MNRAALLAALAGALAPWALAAFAPGPRRRARLRRRRLASSLAGLGRRIGVPAAPGDLEARIAAAGLDRRLTVADAMAVKVGAAAVAGLAALAIATLLHGGAVRLVLVAVAAGFVAPDLWLRRRAGERARRLASELPDCLELLRVAVEAGLAPMRAVAEVAHRHRGLFGAELRVATARNALGVSREAALERLVARCPLPAVAMLVLALERAERHGAPLAPALCALTEDVRAERARSVRERAARAAPKIQLAIALLLVPGVVLLIAAALQAATAG